MLALFICSIIYLFWLPGHDQPPSSQVADRAASIFGDAKPVDTAAKERAIEERLQHEKEDEHKKEEEHRPPPRSVVAPRLG